MSDRRLLPFRLLMRLLSATWRIEEEIPEDCAEVVLHGRPGVILFWHGAMWPIWYRFRRSGAAALVSGSRDGGLLADYLRAIGYDQVIRGSSSKGGSEALQRMVEQLAQRSVLVTPDGPRGPRRRSQAGGLVAAARSGRPVILVGWEGRVGWRFGSWDRMALPAPFARIKLRYCQLETESPQPPDHRITEDDLQALDRKLDALGTYGSTLPAARRLLLPFVPLYAIGRELDRALRGATGPRGKTRHRPPTISIGNITSGGSGKTPLTAWLAERLSATLSVGIASRGYGRASRNLELWRVGDAQPDPALLGDEPALLASSLRRGVMAVANEKERALRALETEGVDLILVDDAFQSWGIERDCDVVLVDSAALHDRLLPAGNLRESPRALGRADILVATDAHAHRALVERFNTTPVLRLETLVERPMTGDGTAVPTGAGIIVVCGIARPERFLDALRQLGYDIAEALLLRDHARYDEENLAAIERLRGRHPSLTLVTTEKDAVKLRQRLDPGIDLAVAKLTVTIDDPGRFIRHLETCSGLSRVHQHNQP